MIAYFDTSALVPLLVAEVGSARAAALWDEADRVVSARLVYPEGRAALARGRRLGRLTGGQLRAAVEDLDARYEELDIVEVDEELARRAGRLAELHSLRTYYAVHLAAADRIRDPDLVVVAGDGAPAHGGNDGRDEHRRRGLTLDASGPSRESTRARIHRSGPSMRSRSPSRPDPKRFVCDRAAAAPRSPLSPQPMCRLPGVVGRRGHAGRLATLTVTASP